MSFFGIDEHISFKDTNAANKLNKIQNNMQTYQESINNDRLSDQWKKDAERELYLEASAENSINKRTFNARRQRLQDIKLEERIMNDVLAGYLTEMTINSMVFDEDFLAAQYEPLYKNINSFVKELMNEGYITKDNFINSSNTMLNEAYYEMTNLVKKAIRDHDKLNINLLDESVIDWVLNEADKASDNADEVENAVREKVTDTLEQEKKIAKKKEEDKEDEISDAADSLDDDKEETKDSDDEDLNDTSDEEEKSDDNSENDDEESDENDEDEEESDDDEEDDDEDDSSDNEQETKPLSSGKLSITIETDGTQVSVNANKSESTEFIGLFSQMKYKERNSKTLFRNLLESNIKEQASLLTESHIESGLKMDMILAETVAEYTFLETMFTSKVFDLSQKDIYSILKTVNFKRN